MTKSSIEINSELVNTLERSFWIELATEFDAEHFCEHLKYRADRGDLALSSMFLEFEQIWRRDELNHTRGFARIYSLLYSVEEDDLEQRLRDRKPDFRAVEFLLKDEFAICVVLAYDEIATTKSYQRDMVARYPRFKNRALVDWIRLVARDEALHFENALSIIRYIHAHRIPEVPGMLDNLLEFDSGESGYGATFVLDHSANNYSPAFLRSCRYQVLRRLGIAEPIKL